MGAHEETPSITLRRLGAADLPLMRKLNRLFGEAFAEVETYTAAPPGDAYLESLLGKEHIVVLAATLPDGEVIGGLVAYELEKFEKARSEIYIYDLAVSGPHRRRRIATSLIRLLGDNAAHRGARVIFVQADYGDAAAIALYESLGSREEVLHFDIILAPRR
jgi:aminoglycoside 3-N-acetyltransferase I